MPLDKPIEVAEPGPEEAVEDVVEDREPPKEAQTVHRIRANSTIMQLKKILGKCAPSRLLLAITSSRQLEGSHLANTKPLGVPSCQPW